MKRKSLRRLLPVVLRVLVLLFFFLLVALPIYWMFITSIKTNTEIINAQQVTYFPHTVTLDNYKQLFSLLNYGTFLRNSVKLSIATAVVVTILSIIGGYGLARFEFKGKGAMLLLKQKTQILPHSNGIIPT